MLDVKIKRKKLIDISNTDYWEQEKSFRNQRQI